MLAPAKQCFLLRDQSFSYLELFPRFLSFGDFTIIFFMSLLEWVWLLVVDRLKYPKVVFLPFHFPSEGLSW